jgi:hypothetical protein
VRFVETLAHLQSTAASPHRCSSCSRRKRRSTADIDLHDFVERHVVTTLEFVGASIRNENTRKAYMTACAVFFDFLADNDVTALEDVGPLHGAAYLEAMKGAKRSVATQKQHMDPLLLFFVLYGFSIANYVAFNADAFRETATQLLAVAQKQGPTVLMSAHRLNLQMLEHTMIKPSRFTIRKHIARLGSDLAKTREWRYYPIGPGFFGSSVMLVPLSLTPNGCLVMRGR